MLLIPSKIFLFSLTTSWCSLNQKQSLSPLHLIGKIKPLNPAFPSTPAPLRGDTLTEIHRQVQRADFRTIIWCIFVCNKHMRVPRVLKWRWVRKGTIKETSQGEGKGISRENGGRGSKDQLEPGRSPAGSGTALHYMLVTSCQSPFDLETLLLVSEFFILSSFASTSCPFFSCLRKNNFMGIGSENRGLQQWPCSAI